MTKRSNNMSGFGSMGAGGAAYESNCQGIASDVRDWFKANPNKIAEAEEINSVSEFCRENKEMWSVIGKYEPSAAQAGVGFWQGVREAKDND